LLNTWHTLNASQGPSKHLVFRDGVEETLALMATAADLIVAYMLVHLGLSPAQGKQLGALFSAL